MAYEMEFVDELDEDDVVFEDCGVKVVIDPKSLVYLDGTRGRLRPKRASSEGFKFNNPNAQG